MPVVINEFEAIAESQRPQEGSAGGPSQAPRIDPQALRLPLRRIAQRHERLKAH
jgi:hypothetical protein